ncbi:MAG: stage V sporulation protein AB [Defluviitaleaceae bacterium]|nr:stage V sporulation protein AB [Defluviitaleaceae bacterium]
MMEVLKTGALIITGLCAGLVVSGAVFAFIAVVGIIPRLAHKSGTQRYIKFYEECIIAGGIFGAGSLAFNYKIPIGMLGNIITGLTYGVFLGCLAVCLAEILNVLPVLGRRAGLQKGLGFFIIALAAGKAAGALIYFIVPGFIKTN